MQLHEHIWLIMVEWLQMLKILIALQEIYLQIDWLSIFLLLGQLILLEKLIVAYSENMVLEPEHGMVVKWW
jgi:hypothetical protein